LNLGKHQSNELLLLKKSLHLHGSGSYTLGRSSVLPGANVLDFIIGSLGLACFNQANKMMDEERPGLFALAPSSNLLVIKDKAAPAVGFSWPHLLLLVPCLDKDKLVQITVCGIILYLDA
jgi:hypothetical protein